MVPQKMLLCENQLFACMLASVCELDTMQIVVAQVLNLKPLELPVLMHIEQFRYGKKGKSMQAVVVEKY